MRTYYRVETVDSIDGTVRGGYMAALHAYILLKYGPEADIKDIKDGLLPSLVYLCDIPVPEIYSNNKEDYICLYTEYGFIEAGSVLQDLNSYVMDELGDMELFVKRFNLASSEIVYEDEYQIVIHRSTYDKHKTEDYYDAIWVALQELEK